MEGMFKTAVGGFKKEDVLAYIDRQETEFREKEADYKKQIRQAADKLAEEQKARQEQTRKAEELAQSIEIVTRKSGELTDQADALRGQVAAAQEETARGDAERDKLTAEIRELRQELTQREEALRAQQAAVEKLRSEGSRAEQAQARISRVLVEAQATADRIVADAKEKAADILAQAQQECTQLVQASDAFRRDVSALRGEVAGAAGRLDGTLLTMEDAAEKFRATYTHAFDGEEPADAVPETEDPSEPADAEAGGARFDFSAARPAE